MTPSRIVFAGCVDFSRHSLETVIRSGGNVVAVFTRRRATQEFNSDFADLEPVCAGHSIPIHFVDSLNAPAVVQRIREYAADLLFVWGWSEIVTAEVLGSTRHGVIGAHPTLLPANRGRHPIIWAIQLGLPATGLTFFWMDRGADTGDILAQANVQIDPSDTAATLYARICEAAGQLIPEFLPRLTDGTAPRMRQDPDRASTWRKRSARDGWIDFRMSGSAIDRLVRALSRPYPGAHVVYRGADVRVWRVEVLPLPPAARNAEFGKVIGVDGNRVDVRADDAVVSLVDHEFELVPTVGSYL